ncbi:putative ribonuclease H-like domain-containing protein [Tanacetum coccineum]|uniref:Ribonuclease H-like domain-containing protein n=1 Tax=Tanacetum coccineum TaxID=301880 RepID=A0ABQ5C6Q2_9ASTR
MAEYSQKWHNRTSSSRSTETSDGLAAIQAQLNNLGREIKKVNEKVYAAQVGCEQCKGPHYTKDCPLKEEGKTLEEAYDMQFGRPFQGGDIEQQLWDSIKGTTQILPKRHEENSNLIKEIRASTDAAIRNQGASIKTLENQISMSKVLQERGFGSLPSSTEENPRDQVKSISTTIEADSYLIRRIGSSQYAVFTGQNRTLMYETRQTTIPFPNRLNGASVSVMPLSTYLNLESGELAHTKLIVELVDRTVKYPKGIAKNVLDHAVVDSGCSSHMTGNKAYLSDYEDYNRGFVAFGSDPKGEFKNHAMNELCAKKGIKMEFSVARTSQQNGVAERKNKTLIEAARTMLADLLLPIPFWAEAVNTACYVQNRVLVTKPQNKTPYELLIDSLGKFDGKSDEGFLLGYSTSSKAFRVYNKRTKRAEENLHINFLEDQLNVARTGSSRKDIGPTQEYILLPLQPYRTRILVKDVVQDTQEKPFENASSDKVVQDSEDVTYKEEQHQMQENEKDLQDELEMMITQELAAKAMDDVSRQAFEEEKRRIASQKKAAQATSTNQLSTDRPFVSIDRSFVSTDRSNTPNVSAASTSTGANADESSFVYLRGKIPIDASTLPNADLPIDPNMPDLEDASDTLPNDGIFNGAYDDDEDVGAVADFNNMDNTIAVSPIPTLRIHKDHPKGQILGDPTSAVQTRGKIQKASSAQQALVEVMQEELLQFKLQQVWILVDLPYGKKEEGIDYDEVFAPVARIEAIRLFLAFTSNMGFTVYQMDVKSAFLYGTIEEEVYVDQPLGFIDSANPNKVYKVDDIIFGSDKKSMCTEFEEIMHKRFQMSSMGELTFFLGLQVKQQPDGIFISQDKYVADILKKFDFCSIKTATTPIESNKPLVKDEDGVEVDVHEYRSMIGSLMYLTASRPDIMFAVCACARFQVTLKASHLHEPALTGNQQLVDVNFLVEDSYLGSAKSRQLWQILLLRQNMLQLLIAMGKISQRNLRVNSGSLQVNSGSLLVNSVDLRIRIYILTISVHQRVHMANLKYSDKHNMVAFLKKPNESVGFTEVVDFLKGTSLRTLANGTQQLVSSIDSKEYTIIEASVRSKLQLVDATGIHNLSDAEIYAGLATLGYVTEGDIVPLLPAMLAGAAMDQGEGSSQLAEPHHTLVDPISSTSQPPIPSPIPSPPHPSPPPHSPPYSPPHSPHQSPPFSPPNYSPPRSYEAPLPEGNTSGSAEENSGKGIKRKTQKVVISKSEGEEPEDQGRIIQDVNDDPLVSLGRLKKKKSILQSWRQLKLCQKLLLKVLAKQSRLIRARDTGGEQGLWIKKINTRLDAEDEINTSRVEINTGIEDVNTSSAKVDSGTTSKRGQREGKAPIVEEDIQATHKTKEQIRQEEAGLKEAIKLQAQMDEEVAKQIHLDELIDKRMAEEEALSEQQKKRKAQVQFEAQYYTEEDWDAIRAKLEANAELTKDVLGKDVPEQDKLPQQNTC